MKLKDKVVFWVLLLLPIISSVLSTIHVISLTSLSNVFSMAIATAVTFEIASLVSFLLSSGTILEKIHKGWVFFIFILLFLLQAIGNIYAGFSFMTVNLAADPAYLDTFIEMCFGIFNITEAKWVIAAAVGLPLPLISLIMIKFALDATNYDETGDEIYENGVDSPKQYMKNSDFGEKSDEIIKNEEKIDEKNDSDDELCANPYYEPPKEEKETEQEPPAVNEPVVNDNQDKKIVKTPLIFKKKKESDANIKKK